VGLAFVLNFARFVLIALEVLVLGRVLVSWVDPGGRGAVSRFLVETTEPLLGPIRRLLPTTGMLDFSPFILLILISFLLRFV
jgi:YggT family protein